MRSTFLPLPKTIRPLQSTEVGKELSEHTLASLDIKPLRQTTAPILPISNDMNSILQQRGIPLGSCVGITGSTSLLHVLLKGPTLKKLWCAIVGMPDFGVLAATELGVDIKRLLFLPYPRTKWVKAASSLLDACSVVVVNLQNSYSHAEAQHLAARARHHRHVLVLTGKYATQWPQLDLSLHCDTIHWDGIKNGDGYLHQQHLEITATGKGTSIKHGTLERHALAS